MIRSRGLANVAEGDKALLWAIPDEWSFEEAATVPVAYGTVYYALVSRPFTNLFFGCINLSSYSEIGI